MKANSGRISSGSAWRDSGEFLLRRQLNKIIHSGTLQLQMPSGRSVAFGKGHPGVMRSNGMRRKMLRRLTRHNPVVRPVARPVARARANVAHPYDLSDTLDGLFRDDRLIARSARGVLQ